MARVSLSRGALLAAAMAAAPAAQAAFMTPIGTYASGVFDESAAEVVAFDAATARLFVVNADADAIDVLDASDPTNPFLLTSLAVDGSPNSVASFGGVIAVASASAASTQAAGSVQFFSATGSPLGQVTVGALPDMLAFTPDGTKVLVAEEGEPNQAYTVDPLGGVSIIDVAGLDPLGGDGQVGQSALTQLNFNAFNGQTEALKAAGLRVFGPGASLAQDVEPEYIAVSPDGQTAFVSLQENNALAKVDLTTQTITDILPLGFKDHSLPGNGLDANRNDDQAVIETLPIFGMYQPDAIAAYEVGGQTFVVTANEGDARDYDGFAEEADLGDLALDPAAFTPAEIAKLTDGGGIGDLTVTETLGDADGDGLFEQVFAFGGRSISIFDADGNLVYDSGDLIERTVAEREPDFFNASNTNNTIDNRSDNKGPEPEGVVLGEVDGRTLAFVGLERQGGIMIFDVTDPLAVSLVDFVNNRDFTVDPELAEAGDLGPEGLLFIAAADSPNGFPLLVVGNEVSGTTTIYQIPEPGSLALAGLGALALGVRRRRA